MKWLLVLLAALPIWAHDLQVTWQQQGSVVIVRSAYAGTESCAYASVEIFGPGDTKTEFQNGRTDAKGMFSFVPDRAGNWRIVVDDELGHRVEKTMDISGGGAAVAMGGAQPIWQKMITGLALIIGLTGFLYGWKARRAR